MRITSQYAGMSTRLRVGSCVRKGWVCAVMGSWKVSASMERFASAVGCEPHGHGPITRLAGSFAIAIVIAVPSAWHSWG